MIIKGQVQKIELGPGGKRTMFIFSGEPYLYLTTKLDEDFKLGDYVKVVISKPEASNA